MKGRKGIVLLVAVGILAIILGATSVLAHDPTARGDETWVPGETWGMHGGGHMGYFDDGAEPYTDGVWESESYCFGYQDDEQSWGMHGSHQGMVGHIAIEEIAEILGLTPEELQARIDEGQTIEQIALEKGVSIEPVIEAVLAPHAEMIAALVQDGYITQEQADGMLEQARLRVEQLVTTQWFGFGHGYCGIDSTDVEHDTTYDSAPRRGFGHRGC